MNVPQYYVIRTLPVLFQHASCSFLKFSKLVTKLCNMWALSFGRSSTIMLSLTTDLNTTNSMTYWVVSCTTAILLALLVHNLMPPRESSAQAHAYVQMARNETCIAEQQRTNRTIHLMFRGPCIVSIFLLIYFQRDATLHSLFISGKLLYMFRAVSPPIIRSTYKFIYSIWYLLTVMDKNKLLVICI